jgi:hypothetical protein
MNVGLWLLLDNQDWQAKPPHSTHPLTFQLVPLSIVFLKNHEDQELPQLKIQPVQPECICSSQHSSLFGQNLEKQGLLHVKAFNDAWKDVQELCQHTTQSRSKPFQKVTE